MISTEVINLEKENAALKEAIAALGKKMEQNAAAKPKSCQYCKHFISYYVKNPDETYSRTYAGNCSLRVPVSKGRCRTPGALETCQFFELGTYDTKYAEVTRKEEE